MPHFSLCSLDYLVWWHFSSMGGCSCPSHFLVSTSFIVLLCRRSLGPVASHIGTYGILETGISLNFVSYCLKSFFYFLKPGGVSLLFSRKKPPLLIYSPHPLSPQRLMSSHLKFSCKKTKSKLPFRSIYKPWHQSTFQTDTSPIPRIEQCRAGD